jgi:hypothetical protein
MRNDSTSRIQTREIDDSELDNISGGSAGLWAQGYSASLQTNPLTSPAAGLLDTLKGAAAPVTGLVQTSGLGLSGLGLGL